MLKFQSWRRKLNPLTANYELIFTKLSEPQIEAGGNYVTEERSLVQGVLNKLELESLDFDICGRIGIKRNDTRRPLRVRVKKITEKIDILKKNTKT